MSTPSSDVEQKFGLFHVCYEIGNNEPGAPLLSVNLLVSTPSKKVAGFGTVTQAINPPLDVTTKLDGSYTYVTVMPDSSHILVTLTGYPFVQWPHFGGVGPVIPPNVTVQMVLQDDWKSGTATFTYSDGSGTWHTIADVPVRSGTCPVLPQ